MDKEKIIYKYTPADKSKRPVKEIPLGMYVTSRRGLYNENLTADELMLLRSLIWDIKTKDPMSEFIGFIHTWMFTNNKTPTVFTDIVAHLEDGVPFEEQ